MASPLDVADPYVGAGSAAKLMANVMMINTMKFPTISTFDPTPENVSGDYYGYLSAAAFGGGIMMIGIILYVFVHLTAYLCCTCRCQCCHHRCAPLHFSKEKPNWVYFGISMGILALSLSGFVPLLLYNTQWNTESGRMVDAAQAVFDFKTEALTQVRTLETSFDPAIELADRFINQTLDVYFNGTLYDDLAQGPQQLRDAQTQVRTFGDAIDISIDAEMYIEKARSSAWWQYLCGWLVCCGILLALGIQYAVSYAGPEPEPVCQSITEGITVLVMGLILIGAAGMFILFTGLSHVCVANPVAFVKEVYSSTATDYYLECNGLTTSPLQSTFDDGENNIANTQMTVNEGIQYHNDSDLIWLDWRLERIREEMNTTRDLLRCHHITPLIVRILDVGCGSWFDTGFRLMITLMVVVFFAVIVNFCLMPRKYKPPRVGQDTASDAELTRFIPPSAGDI